MTTTMQTLSLKRNGSALSVVTALSLWANAPMVLTEEEEANFDRFNARAGYKLERTEQVRFSMGPGGVCPTVEHLNEMDWELYRSFSKANAARFTAKYAAGDGDIREVTVHKLSLGATDLTPFEASCYSQQEHLRQLDVFSNACDINGKGMSQFELGMCDRVPLYLTIQSSGQAAWEHAEGGYPIYKPVPQVLLGIEPIDTCGAYGYTEEAETTLRDLMWDLYHIASWLWGGDYYDVSDMGQGRGYWSLGLQPIKYLPYLGYR